MLNVLLARLQQKHRTIAYPKGPPPPLPDRFAGRPVITSDRCSAGCCLCVEACPTGAVLRDAVVKEVKIDIGACLFCGECAAACPNRAIAFTRDYSMAVARRDDLIVESGCLPLRQARSEEREVKDAFLPTPNSLLAASSIKRLFGRSLKLRQVSAGGCNACEADTNVLGTIAWDLGRFGIQFVASPRHADGLLVTGTVPENMRIALLKTYEAVPAPKVVISVGACAISGGPYRDHKEVHNGAGNLLPVDLYIPGCPPHPLTILDGLLRFIGRIS